MAQVLDPQVQCGCTSDGAAPPPCQRDGRDSELSRFSQLEHCKCTKSKIIICWMSSFVALTKNEARKASSETTEMASPAAEKKTLNHQHKTNGTIHFDFFVIHSTKPTTTSTLVCWLANAIKGRSFRSFNKNNRKKSNEINNNVYHRKRSSISILIKDNSSANNRDDSRRIENAQQIKVRPKPCRCTVMAKRNAWFDCFRTHRQSSSLFFACGWTMSQNGQLTESIFRRPLERPQLAAPKPLCLAF